MIYCMSCRRQTANKGPLRHTTTNGHARAVAHCASCGAKKSAFVKAGRAGSGIAKKKRARR